MNMQFIEVKTATRKWRDEGGTDNGEAKTAWKKASMGFMKALSRELGCTRSKIGFCQGGPAVSGEANMFATGGALGGKTAYFNLSADYAMYMRQADSFTDYTGKQNLWPNLDDCETFLESVRLNIKRRFQ